jgi:hypothetical protein
MTSRRHLGTAVSIAVLAAALSASGGLAQSPEPSPDASPAPPADSGPLTGDLSVIPTEVSCISDYAADPDNNYVNYWPAISAPEHADAIHTGVNPCATFTGEFDGPNQVFQHVSDTTYPPGVWFVVFDGPDAGYLLGGGGGAPPVRGAYAARFAPDSGQEVWRTQLVNLDTTGQWFAAPSLAIHKNGYLIASAGPTIFKIDRDTGAIVASQQQPILDGGPTNVNFDGMAIAPDDNGTIILKTQTRSPGCPTQGNAAMFSCQADYGPQPNTTVIAADPDTLENLDAIELDQEITARPIVTTHDGKIYTYLLGTSTLSRVQWDPQRQKLSVDESWAPEYLLDGQFVGDAPGILGNWVLANQNAQPGTVPMCVVAVSQDDASNLQRLCPWGDTLPDGVPFSESPASFSVDPELGLVFAQDWIVGGVYAVSLDQDSGEMAVAWSRPDWRTSDYFSMIGPPDQRVLISQYLNPDFTTDQLKGETYTESVLWANAATGETIAQSAYNPSTAIGSLPNVGYGGRLYMMGNDGNLYIYQVEEAAAPAPEASPSPSASP